MKGDYDKDFCFINIYTKVNLHFFIFFLFFLFFCLLCLVIICQILALAVEARRNHNKKQENKRCLVKS